MARVAYRVIGMGVFGRGGRIRMDARGRRKLGNGGRMLGRGGRTPGQQGGRMLGRGRRMLGMGSKMLGRGRQRAKLLVEVSDFGNFLCSTRLIYRFACPE